MASAHLGSNSSARWNIRCAPALSSPLGVGFACAHIARWIIALALDHLLERCQRLFVPAQFQLNARHGVQRLPVFGARAHGLGQIRQGTVGIACPIEGRTQLEIIPPRSQVVFAGERKGERTVLLDSRQVAAHLCGRRNGGIHLASAAFAIHQQYERERKVLAVLEQIPAKQRIRGGYVVLFALQID